MVHLASSAPSQVVQTEESSVATVVSRAMHSRDVDVVQPALLLLNTLLAQVLYVTLCTTHKTKIEH